MGACTLSHLKNGRGGGIVAAQSTSNRLCKYLSLNLMSNSAFTIYKIDSPASPRIPIGNRYGGPSTTNISVVCLKSHGTTSLWNLIKYATDQALGGGTSDYIATSLAIQPHPVLIRLVLYSIKAIYSNSHGTPSILLCGDIESNPGPRPKVPADQITTCHVCHKTINR